MAVRKIYTSIDEKQQLEIQWSPFGIHLTISEEDKEFATEFLIQESDISEFIDDMIEHQEAIIESEKSFSDEIEEILKNQ